MTEHDEHQPDAQQRVTVDWPHGIEWLWWGLLVLSLIVGFGLTIFAPI
jgi:hypothetical protein